MGKHKRNIETFPNILPPRHTLFFKKLLEISSSQRNKARKRKMQRLRTKESQTGKQWREVPGCQREDAKRTISTTALS
jgi:hypothetical protein